MGIQRWYAVLTHVRAEALAARHLKRQGYGVLYLHYPATVRHARRSMAVIRPYFPRYVFARTGEACPIGPVARTIGVAALVQAGPEPLEIPEPVIAELASRGDSHGRIALQEPERRKRLEPGLEVAIASGPFAGLMATIALDDGITVRLSLRWLGRLLKLTVDPDVVSATSPGLRSAPEAFDSPA